MEFRHLPLFMVTLASIAMGLSACATNPVTKSSDFVMMSETQELALGQQAAAEVQKTLPLLDKNDPLVRYVDSVGQKLAAVSDRPNLFYRFHVVDNADINAFATPCWLPSMVIPTATVLHKARLSAGASCILIWVFNSHFLKTG